ncbi:polysaccharide deacetylase family protein [Kitasatospora sp. NPDC101176]|uniref:polysaccharide deacetylase family protein n=1 Tax=Kitasatospora sp. NPDC101176 TaxID=3364099 RepID=UPI0037F7893F
MFYSGVSWSAEGYHVHTVDQDGLAAAPLHFAPARTEELIRHLRGLDGPLVTVVESTNGILDGRLMAAGITVHRIDAHALPARPPFSSVGAEELARTARLRPSALVPLERRRGTQTGREGELEAWIASTTAEVAALTRAGRLISHGGAGRREVALTFDDGPLPPYTDRILDVLERYRVPATFFCVGMNAGAHPDLLVRMREQGHLIGNHTWSHPFLPELTRAQLVEQLERTDEAIATASGGPAPTLFRPPYGARTPEVLGWLEETFARIALWDVAPDDWTMPGAEAISALVLEQARPGSIVLLHDGGGDRTQTVDALPAIIEGLHGRGYRFVTVDELAPPTQAPPAGAGLSGASPAGAGRAERAR